ncbi:MAG: hypothetical protein HC904_15545 [Blastochloris sp.]|nr:hypothetical protein [Blastochloris sp.]
MSKAASSQVVEARSGKAPGVSSARKLGPAPRGISLMRVFGYSFIILGLLICGLLLTFRYIGLPNEVGVRISQELKQRGIHATYKKLYLSPLGGVVARQLTIQQSLGGVTKTLSVDDLRFGFNWISWWRGESFLENASMNGAELTLPLDAGSGAAVKLRNVSARLQFKPDTIVVQSLEADLLKIHFKLKGSLHLEGYEPSGETEELDLSAHVPLWKKIEEISAEVNGLDPLVLDIQGEVYLAQPESSQVRVRLSGRRQEWRGVLLEQVALDAEYLEGRLRMDGELRFLRGSFKMEGNWKTSQKKAAASFYCDADLTLLAGALPERAREFMKDLRFRTLPINEGRLEMEWEKSFSYLLQTRSNWRDFSVQGAYFQSLYCPISYDGRRFLITEMSVVNASGRSTLSAFHDGAAVTKANLKSKIDPTSFQKIFGDKAQPFFNSLKFTEAPYIEASVHCQGLDFSTAEIQGVLAANQFSYKGVALKEVKTPFSFRNNELHLADLKVKREEGEGSGEIWYDLKTRQVRLKGVKGRLKIRETATIIGDKMAEYAKPYGFYEAPEFRVEGVVDLETQEKTDLKAYLKADKGLEYVFLGKLLSLKKVEADLTIKGKELRFVPRKPMSLFEGELMGDLVVQMNQVPSYAAQLQIKDQQFGQLMKTFFDNKDVSGKITGALKVRGNFDDMSTMNGEGDFTVVKGFLYNIPMFGGFSEVLNSIVPNLGYSEASQAKTKFEIKQGVITISEVDVFSTAFALIGNGTYDMVKDEVNMNMRVNLRGVLGIPFFWSASCSSMRERAPWQTQSGGRRFSKQRVLTG